MTDPFLRKLWLNSMYGKYPLMLETEREVYQVINESGDQFGIFTTEADANTYLGFITAKGSMRDLRVVPIIVDYPLRELRAAIEENNQELHKWQNQETSLESQHGVKTREFLFVLLATILSLYLLLLNSSRLTRLLQSSKRNLPEKSLQ